MKKIIRILPRGLQKKTVLLVFIMLLVMSLVFYLLSTHTSKTLTQIVGDTRTEQQQAISQISKETMHSILTGTMVNNVALQAKLVENDFAEVVNNVYMLQSLAEGIYADRDLVPQAVVNPPDPALEGVPSVMYLAEAGVDPSRSEYLGVMGNLARPMLAMLENSDKIDACYIGLADGVHVVAHDQTLAKLDSSGKPLPFPVRERPWYTGALEADGLYFTDLEADAFTGVLMVTCSIPVKADGQVIGVAGIDIVMDSMRDFVNVSDDKVGTVFVMNEDGHVILSSEREGPFSPGGEQAALDLRERGNPELTEVLNKALSSETELALIHFDGVNYYVAGAAMPTAGWAVVSLVRQDQTEEPEKAMLSAYDRINEEASARFRESSVRTQKSGSLILAAVVLLSLLGAFIGATRIVKPLRDMTATIIDSGQTGKLFEMKDSYRTGDEIEVLAESFDDLSKKTRAYIQDITRITREKERVNTELGMANQIQTSMLPHIFPAFPSRKEFDIHASMTPAKAVGGDFYDFFLIDPDHLCMVIADVSGKGIPAALFMMVTKAILKNNAMLGRSAAEILSGANETICTNNKMDMFVTVWLGILEISTGRITAANAGHEYPALQQNGVFSLVKDDPHGFVIGGLEGTVYREYELRLRPGDRIFLYTDGVPEAMDASEAMFGTDRMLEALNRAASSSPAQILDSVRSAVDAFVQDAEQFDDLTMLCVEYKGPQDPELPQKAPAAQ